MSKTTRKRLAKPMHGRKASFGRSPRRAALVVEADNAPFTRAGKRYVEETLPEKGIYATVTVTSLSDARSDKG